MPNYHPFTPDTETIASQLLKGASGSSPAGVAGAAGASPASRHHGELPRTLDGLTALRDAAFVDAAYRVLLGRDADPAGFAHALQQLRAGDLDKVDILGDLRYSSEGRQRAVEIAGLDWRYRIRRIGRWRGVGWPVRWALTLLRLPAVARVGQRHQSAIELAAVAAEQHATAIQQMGAEARVHERTFDLRLQAAEGALAELLDVARSTSASLAELTARLEATEKMFEARHQHLSTANARLMTQLREIRSAPAPAAPVPIREPAPAPAQPGSRPAGGELDDWYLAFEDQFRGTREQTKQTQELYLEYVATAAAGTPDAPILDIGCGRGEWLELLQEHGCTASGVDLNEAMVAENRRRGLEVVYGDALSHLGALGDDSLGMITGFHIIEHIRFDLLVRLFDECRRVLRPGGCILFETPNPENLVVGAYTFYFDPTHRHPLPPKMIEFVVRARGYAEAEIVRLHPRGEEGIDQALLDKWFRGPTDYAVVGWKDRRGTAAPPS